MIIPVRCFTCGKVIGNKWKVFQDMLRKEEDTGKVLDELGLRKFCCRRMMLCHIELIDTVLDYNEKKEE